MLLDISLQMRMSFARHWPLCSCFNSWSIEFILFIFLLDSFFFVSPSNIWNDEKIMKWHRLIDYFPLKEVFVCCTWAIKNLKNILQEISAHFFIHSCISSGHRERRGKRKQLKLNSFKLSKFHFRMQPATTRI